MKHVARLGTLVLLLVLLTSKAAAAPACQAQPSNPDGTTIAKPAPDQLVTSPFTISGQYFGSFEGVVPIRVLDASGAVLLDVNAMNECCKLAPYERQVTFSVSAPTPACIVVYRESGADGSLTPLAQIPVTLSPVAGMPNTGEPAGFPIWLALGLAAVLAGAGAALRRRMAPHR